MIQGICEPGCRPTTAHVQHLYARAGKRSVCCSCCLSDTSFRPLSVHFRNIYFALCDSFQLYPTSPWYYNLVLVGVQLHRHGIGDPRSALEYYKRADEIDSNFTDSLCAILQVILNIRIRKNSRVLFCALREYEVGLCLHPAYILRQKRSRRLPKQRLRLRHPR